MENLSVIKVTLEKVAALFELSSKLKKSFLLLFWKIAQSVFSRFQGALTGNVRKHFQESLLEYSEKQIVQASPEPCEKYGVVLDCNRGNILRSANVIRGRPKSFFPKFQFYYRKFLEYLFSKPAFNRFYYLRNRERRRKAQKQVNVIRLNLFFNYSPLSFFADAPNFLRKKLSNRPYQNMSPVLRTPEQRAGGLTDKVSSMFHLNHKPIMHFLPLLKQEVSCASEVL